LAINHGPPPFDKQELRRAMALSLDRKAFIDIISARQGDVGGVMQPAPEAPEGLWGMPPEILHTLPGYGPEVQESRVEARQIMERHGYGPENRLKVKVTTRDTAAFRDPAALLIDQLTEVYIDGDLEPVDTTNYFPKMLRKDYSVALVGGAGGNDPDQGLYTTYVCNAERNTAGYCSPEFDALTDRQSREADQEKRKRLVWDAERKLAEDGAQPVILYTRQATCRQPYVKGLTIMVNSIFNGNRREDIWLDEQPPQ
jgi:peptide/nickel transport system substrate-binding protein